MRYVIERGMEWGSPVATFRPARCIRDQRIEFVCNGHTICVGADYSTPLYETITEIVEYDCYFLDHLTTHIDGIVLDAGANVGVASLVLAARLGARVLALEPIESNFRTLEANLGANPTLQIQPIRAALASVDGNLRLWQSKGHSVSARLWDQSAGDAPPDMVEHLVPALSLRSLLYRAGATNVGLLKMDIEGAEHPWLESLASEEAALIQRITMEVHERGRAGGVRSVRRRLRDLGFHVREKPEMFGRRTLRHLFAWRE